MDKMRKSPTFAKESRTGPVFAGAVLQSHVKYGIFNGLEVMVAPHPLNSRSWQKRFRPENYSAATADSVQIDTPCPV